MIKILFDLLFNNKVICNLIFQNVKIIHKINLQLRGYSWNQVINEEPEIMAYYSLYNHLKEYYENNPFYLSKHIYRDRTLRAIIRNNRLDLFTYFLDQWQSSVYFDVESLLECAARYDRVDFIKYLEKLTCINNFNKEIQLAMSTAAQYYSVVSLKYFVNKLNDASTLKSIKDEEKCSVIFQSVSNVLSTGRLDMFQWMVDNYQESFSPENKRKWKVLFEGAVKSSNIKILLHIYTIFKKNYPGNISSHLSGSSLMDIAAEKNNNEVLKWLHLNIPHSCSSQAMNNAVMQGNLPMVKWLHQNRNEGCTYEAMDNAVIIGRLDIVQWLHENCTEGYSEWAIASALSNGHIEVIKWLIINRWAVNSVRWAKQYAARHGHFDFLIWLYEKYSNEGSTTDIMDNAAIFGNLEIIKWLHENRSERYSKQVLTHAARYGHLDAIIWMFDHFNIDSIYEAICNAAYNNQLHVIKWFHEISIVGRCKIDKKILDSLVHISCYENRFNILYWLLENRPETSMVFFFQSIISHNDLRLVDYLCKTTNNSFDSYLISALQMENYEIAHRLVNNRKYEYEAMASDMIKDATLKKMNVKIIEWLKDKLQN